MPIRSLSSPLLKRRQRRTMLVGAEVACRPLEYFVREVERQGHSVDRLFAGIPFDRQALSDRGARMDWESFRRMMSNLGELWSDEQLVAAGKGITRSRWVRPFAAVASLFYRTSDLYRWMADPDRGSATQYFTCLVNEIGEEGPGWTVFLTTMRPGYRTSREALLIFRGSLIVAPRFLGLEEARVEVEELPNGARYTIHYPPHLGLWARFRQWVGLPEAARAVARELEEVSHELRQRSDQLASESSHRATAEAALRESESLFRRAFHAAPTLMAISSFEGRFIDVNETFAQTCGFRRDELVGRDVRELGLWRELSTRDQIIETLRRGEAVRGVEAQVLHRSGEPRVGLISAEQIVLAGESCIIWQAVDITERLRAEDQNRRLQERMLQAQKLESLGVMASGIAHDFNNLLVGILGNAELALAEAPADGGLRQRLEGVLTASQHAADLTREMLALAGRGVSACRPFDLTALVEETAAVVRSGLPKDVRVEVRSSEQPIFVEGDETRLRQVVMNLMTNAAEAYGKVPGTVEVAVGVVEEAPAPLESWYADEGLPEGECARVEVSDEGCGMNEETVQRIFDPFFSTKPGGRGLGLAATLGIVKSHRGALRVSSRSGRGTRFEVLLPRVQSEVAEADSQSEAEAEAGGTVLVVDDEDGVRWVAQTMLERAGYDTLSASGGKQAIEIVLRSKTPVAAVLLDLTMPGMDGEATFRELRRLRPELPVVCYSGHGDEVGARFLDGRSRVAFLPKPFTSESLRRAVREALSVGEPLNP